MSESSEPAVVAAAFTPAIKTCQDLLVDDVERHVGVPIVGTPAPDTEVTAGDVERARRDLARAGAALDRDRRPARRLVVAAGERLDARPLGSPGGVAIVETAPPRQLRAVRAQLYEAVEHLTTVPFDPPEPELG